MRSRFAFLFGFVFLVAIANCQDALDEIRIPFFSPKKWALCIGTQNYTSITPLKYAAGDARAFSDCLKQNLGFSDESVTLLADAQGGTPATSQNVSAAIDRMLADRSLDRGDLVIIYFSGHGVGLDDGDYWLPNNVDIKNPKATAIRIESVVRKLVAKKLRNVVIISDACRAGEKNTFGNALISLGRKSNIAVLLGCAPGAKSYEDARSKHGYFTNYLMRNIASLNAVDAKTGALRVSALGQRVAASVEGATKAEFGANAQKPLIAADKEQEVILGTFIRTSGEGAVSAKQILDELKSGAMTKEAANDLLFQTALSFENDQDYSSALEIYRQLRAIGYQGRAFELHYLTMLIRENRTSEANRVFDGILDNPEPSLWVDLLSLFAPSQLVSPARLANAAQSLFNSEYRDATLGSLDAELRDRGMTTEREALHKRMETLKGTVWPSFAAVARVSTAGKPEQIEKALAAFPTGGDDGSASELAARNAYQGYIRTRDFARGVALADKMLAKNPGSGYWGLKRLVLATILLEPDVKDRVRAQLAKCERGRFAMDSLLLVGADAVELADDYAKTAERLSGNFEAQVAAWVAESLRHPGEVQMLPERLLKLAPSDVEQFSVPFITLSDTLQRTLQTRRFEPDVIQRWNFRLGFDLADFWDEYGEATPQLLIDIFKLYNRSDEGWRVRTIYLAAPDDYFDEWIASDRSEIYEQAAISMINYGDMAAAENAISRLKELGGDTSTLNLRLGIAHVFRGYLDGGKIAIEEALKRPLTGTVKTLVKLLEIHLAIAEKDQKRVDAMLEGITKDDQFSHGTQMYLHYLALLNHPEKVLTEETAKDLLAGSAEYHDVHSAIVRLAAERMRSLKTDDVIRDNVTGTMVLEPTNQWLDSVVYPGFEKVSDYAGTYEASGTFVTPGGTADTLISLVVSSDGKAKGKIYFEGDPTEVLLSGEVSEAGLLSGTATFPNGKSGTIALRLLPHKVWSTLAPERMPLHKLIFESAHPKGVMFAFDKRKGGS